MLGAGAVSSKIFMLCYVEQEREKAHETPLLLPDGGVRTPQEEVKLLGITLDSCLNFRSHIKNMTSRAERTL